MCGTSHISLTSTVLYSKYGESVLQSLDGRPGLPLFYGRVKSCEYCDRQNLNPSKTECESCGAPFYENNK